MGSNRTYWGFLRDCSSGPLLVASCIARSAAGLLPYGITVFYVARNEIFLAGVVSAAMMISGSLTSGIRGRIVTKYSPRIALVSMSIVSAAASLVMVGVDGILIFDTVKRLLELLCAIGIGVAMPPVSAVIRDVWNNIAVNQTENTTLHSLDSVLEETVFAVTPFVLATIWLLLNPGVGVAVSAVLGVLGNVVLVAFGVRSTPQVKYVFVHKAVIETANIHERLDKAYWFRGAFSLLSPQYGLGFGLSALTLLLPKETEIVWGSDALSGYVLSLISVSGMLATLLWGKRHHMSHARAYALLSFLVAVSDMMFVSATFVGNRYVAGTTLVIAAVLYGSAMSPMFVTAYTWIDMHIEPDRRIVVNSLLGGAYNLGDGCSSVMTGLISALPLRGALSFACAIAAVAELPAAGLKYVGAQEGHR